MGVVFTDLLEYLTENNLRYRKIINLLAQGLNKKEEVTEAGYRLYDDTALERLQHILFFKELEFSLKEIKEILDRPDFDRSKALEQQIHLLELWKEHITENYYHCTDEILHSL